jgi:polyribonucleotide nucleotidyltransferase
MTIPSYTKTFEIGDGRTISIETGRLARQADGAVVVRQGNTMLLATVVSSKKASDVDFLPLSVDYQEKYSATGRFPGGFFKREARPSEYEILISRLVDRALRPLFPSDYRSETQVIISLISADKKDAPDALAALAASAALTVSDIPFAGPISEVRVARIDGEFVVNPMLHDIERADLDLIVAATMDNIMMVEGEMKEVSEDDIIDALQVAHEAIKVQCQAQLDLVAMLPEPVTTREYTQAENDEELKDLMQQQLFEKVYQIAARCNPVKLERKEAFAAALEEFVETLDPEVATEKASLIKQYFYAIEKEAIRSFVLKERKRLDGRQLDEVRPIWSEVDYLPAAHGSAIFTRGETQSLTTITLGTKLNEQIIDGAVIDGKSNFILHYNFPGFCTGEVKRSFTSRREIGHGNLALRALKPMIPHGELNPYTIRIVSDILESNGSSSMATVCAGSLALMDAGVQIPKAVSGIAMGMISDAQTGEFAILSDILGDEDHLGDMDFKVAGTMDGINACQMDIKVDGLSFEVLKQALEQANKGRLHILQEMNKTISVAREDYKPHVPRIEKITIPKEFIGAIIGPGGKIIQEMQRETNTVIVLEEVGDLGVIDIASDDVKGIEAVKARIRAIIAVPEIGEVYQGTVKNIVPFGAFVEIMPGKEGLLHISEIEWRRLEKVEDVLTTGQTIEVKLIDVDNKTGKLKLSRKALIPRPQHRD